MVNPSFNLDSNLKNLSEWIQKGIASVGGCLDFMENVGFLLCDKKSENDNYAGYNAMTTSQIRNIFTEIKRIQVKADKDNWKTPESNEKNPKEVDFMLLKPKVAYSVARVLSKNRGSKIQTFRKVFDKAHEAVKEFAQFTNFCQIMEGILAYHKVYGGKD